MRLLVLAVLVFGVATADPVPPSPEVVARFGETAQNAGRVEALCFAADGTRAVTAHRFGTLLFWDLRP